MISAKSRVRLAITFSGSAAVIVAGLLSGCSSHASSQLQSAYSPSALSPSTQASAPPAPAASPSTDRPPAISAPRRSARSAPRAAGVPGDVPMPNRALTPGAIQSGDTAAICTPGWAEAHRDVSQATEDYVAREYGLSSHSGYEIDHLIPLELGGSNNVLNLWPELYSSAFGATQKDGLEGYLHEQVCYHGLPLVTAQHEIAANWYAAWVSAGRPTAQDSGYGTGTGSGTAPSSASAQPTAPPPAAPATPASTAPAGCRPLSNERTCYEPGEFCRKVDRGTSGVAGDGEAITCEDNNGWRWEPS